MTFDEWIAYGITQGWCGPPVCYTHDGLPTSEAEQEDLWENELCVSVMRIYENAEQKQAVEADHSPSQWRNHYTPSEGEEQ